MERAECKGSSGRRGTAATARSPTARPAASHGVGQISPWWCRWPATPLQEDGGGWAGVGDGGGWGGGARRGEIEEAGKEELARDPFRISFYRNLCYDTVSTYVTVTLSLFFNSLPCHHFC